MADAFRGSPTLNSNQMYDALSMQNKLKYRYGEPKEKMLHLNRKDATKPLACINTDLHQQSFTDKGVQFKILIAFLDNFSRKILHYELLQSKEAVGTANALQHLIDKVGRFGLLYTDNGTEFKAQFDQVLQRNGIDKDTIIPHEAAMNGK